MPEMRHIALLADGWGDITPEQADSMALFECGHCSIEGVTAYHPVVGQHCHRDVRALIEAPAEGESANA